MKAIVTGNAKKLFTVETPCCAFLFFAFFTNSDSFMLTTSFLTYGRQCTFNRVMFDVIALRAQKNLTVDAPTVDFAIFAEFTSNIHS